MKISQYTMEVNHTGRSRTWQQQCQQQQGAGTHPPPLNTAGAAEAAEAGSVQLFRGQVWLMAMTTPTVCGTAAVLAAVPLPQL